MSDEQPTNEKGYQTYADKIDELRADEGEKLFREKDRQGRLLLSSKEQSLAQALVRLSGSEDWKTVLEFESIESSERILGAFSVPPGMDKHTFGEQMAFNKGRSYQMAILRNKRDNIVKAYLNMLKSNNPELNENGGQNG